MNTSTIHAIAGKVTISTCSTLYTVVAITDHVAASSISAVNTIRANIAVITISAILAACILHFVQPLPRFCAKDG